MIIEKSERSDLHGAVCLLGSDGSGQARRPEDTNDGAASHGCRCQSNVVVERVDSKKVWMGVSDENRTDRSEGVCCAGRFFDAAVQKECGCGEGNEKWLGRMKVGEGRWTELETGKEIRKKGYQV